MVTRKSCIDVSSAARIIGAYTMSTSILMINVLASNFFSRNKDEDFFESVKTWAILGLNWMQVFRYTNLQNKVHTAMVCFLIYIILFLAASAYLSLGFLSVVNNDLIADRIQICQTLFIRKMYFGHVTALSQLANDYTNFRIRSQRRHKYAVPWMYLQMISIIDQIMALCDYIIQDRQNVSLTKSMACSIHLILSICLWTVVQAARKQLYEEEQQHVEYESRLPNPSSVSFTNSSSLKSPSFLSQNFSMFESPQSPTILNNPSK